MKTLSDQLREIASGIMCDDDINIDEEDAARELRIIACQLDAAAEALGGLSFPDSDPKDETAEETWLESMDILTQVSDSLGHQFRNLHQKTGFKSPYRGHAIKPSKKRLELLQELKKTHAK